MHGKTVVSCYNEGHLLERSNSIRESCVIASELVAVAYGLGQMILREIFEGPHAGEKLLINCHGRFISYIGRSVPGIIHLSEEGRVRLL